MGRKTVCFMYEKNTRTDLKSILGANIGTSVTNTIVALTQSVSQSSIYKQKKAKVFCVESTR